MKKKLLSLALVLAMALTLLPTAAFAEAGTHDTTESGSCASATYTETQGQAATCTAAGWKSYYTCSGCSNLFADDQGQTPIADLDTWKAGDGKIEATGHQTTKVEAVVATCGSSDKSVAEHWKCSACSKLFAEQAATTEKQLSELQTEPAADHTFTKTGTPSGKCDTCGYACEHTGATPGQACDTCGVTVADTSDCTGKADCPAENHNKDCISQCTENANCPNTAGNASVHKDGCPKASSDPGPAEPVTITNVTAQYDGSTLTVNWTLSATLAQAVKFEVKVDSDAITDKDAFTFETAAMGKDSADCSFTKQISIPDGTHTVIIHASGVSESGRASFTVSTAPSTPAEPSDGIPNPGSVTTPAAAESAIKNIQSAGADKIAAEIEKELADTSSDASTATIDKLEKLETAVMDQANIKVSVSPDSKVPEALNTKKVSIIGAALNAEKTSNTKVELKISAPKTERTLGRNYDNDVAVQFSMTLTNVVNSKKLAVPVIITVPLPAGISSSKAVVLHYAGTDSASQVLQSKVSGGYISFAATGFSDFIITQRVERKTSSGGGGGGGTKVTNIPVTVTPTVPSAPAGIFTDVPASHSFASQITWARDNGVMGGYADGSFRPANPTNRQQLWMVLARLSGAAPADMAAAREWAVNSGVSDGANGEGALSRQQLVTMLYRYAQSQEMNLEGAADLAAYPDNAAVASYAQEALAWAVGKGIVTGTSDGRLNPEGTATRGQFAVIMYRFSHQG